MNKKAQFQHGDVLHCYSTRLLSRAIRRVTRGRFNHTAIVVQWAGMLFIADSQNDGTQLRPFDEWTAKYGYKYIIHRSILYPDLTFQENLTERVLKVIGSTPYDFKSLLWYYPRYVVSGRWRGKRKDAALKRMFCSEFVAYVHNVDNFWKISPQELYEILEDNKIYFQVWNDYNKFWEDEL